QSRLLGDEAGEEQARGRLVSWNRIGEARVIAAQAGFEVLVEAFRQCEVAAVVWVAAKAAGRVPDQFSLKQQALIGAGEVPVGEVQTADVEIMAAIPRHVSPAEICAEAQLQLLVPAHFLAVPQAAAPGTVMAAREAQPVFHVTVRDPPAKLQVQEVSSD